MLGKGHQLMSIHSQNRDLEEHTPSSLCYLPTLSGGCVSVAALKGKAFPHRSGSALLGQGRFPQRKCFTVFQKVSWQLGAKEYNKVTAHNKPHRRFIGRGKPRRVAASAEERSSRELSRRDGLYSFFCVCACVCARVRTCVFV